MKILEPIEKVVGKSCVLPLLLAFTFIDPLVNTLFKLLGCGGLHSPYYFVGYSTGFGGRKFLGWLVSLLYPSVDVFHHHHLVPFVFGAFCVLVILFVVYVWIGFKRGKQYDDKTGVIVIALVTFYLISSYGIGRLLPFLAWYADVWLYLITLVFLLLWFKLRGHWTFYVLTAVVAVAGCLVHHIFCCIFFPLFVVLFLYDTFSNDRLNIGKGIVYGAICLGLVVLLYCIWSFSAPIDIDALYSQVVARTNNVCTRDRIVFQWLYGSNADNYKAMWEIGQFPFMYYAFLPVLVLLSPMVILLMAPWVMAIKHSRNKVERTKYWLIVLASSLIFLPAFVIATDYNRWWAAWFFCQTMLLVAMCADGNDLIIQQLKRIYQYLRQHVLLTAVLLIYICSFSVDQCGSYLVSAILYNLL